MPEFSHKITGRGWGEDFYVDANDPYLIYAGSSMQGYRSHGVPWLAYYPKNNENIQVTPLKLNLENK